MKVSRKGDTNMKPHNLGNKFQIIEETFKNNEEVTLTMVVDALLDSYNYEGIMNMNIGRTRKLRSLYETMYSTVAYYQFFFQTLYDNERDDFYELTDAIKDYDKEFELLFLDRDEVIGNKFLKELSPDAQIMVLPIVSKNPRKYFGENYEEEELPTLVKDMISLFARLVLVEDVTAYLLHHKGEFKVKSRKHILITRRINMFESRARELGLAH